MRKFASVLLLAALAFGCAAPTESEPAVEPPVDIETRSLLGRTLSPPELTADVRAEREAELETAREAFEANPADVEALIWFGRRTAYLGQYRKAVEIFSGGIEQHPEDPRLYRHRGHRLITLRRFDDAIRDLERAAGLVAGQPDEIEPDGLPNARNQPTSTLQSNIWYHLGLAHYLRGDYEAALGAYRECVLVSKNPDMLSATTHWLYMTLRRLERGEEAKQILDPIRAEMDIIENHGYHRLLLMYKGELAPQALLDEIGADGESIESASVAYGLANWLIEEGDEARGERILASLADSPQWAAFGVIAAEADLARGGDERSRAARDLPTLTREQTHNKFSRDIEPRLRVPSGTTVRFETEEATDGQLRPDSTAADLATVDFDLVHPLTGPVFVEGAEPGDVLKVTLERVERGDWGWNGILPGFSFLADEFTEPYLRTYRFGPEDRDVVFVDGVRVPLRPFPGVIAVAPDTAERLSTIPPRANGGNMDDKDIIEGAIVYLPVFVPGALFSIGDGHAAQGDGEVCGTAIEIPMTVEAKLEVIKGGRSIREPQYEHEDYYAVTAFGTDIDEAARKATRYMLDYLVQSRGLDRTEAYALASVAADLKISEVVDMPHHLVTMKIPKSIFVDR